MIPKTDSGRIYVSAVLVYAVFWNPWLQSSMTWNYIDAAVSLVDTGRWELAHPHFYRWVDIAIAGGGRVIPALPPGMSLLIAPVYILWHVLVGHVDTEPSFQAFNAFLALTLGANSSALGAVQVYWMAGRLGASRNGQLWSAILFAFGTQDFAFGTMVFKENVVALSIVTAIRLAVERGRPLRLLASGFLAGTAPAFALTTALFPPLLLLLVVKREGWRRGIPFFLGSAIPVLALGTYYFWLFGTPWHVAYFSAPIVKNPSFVLPKPLMLLEFLAGPANGLFLYSPWLIFGVAGLLTTLRTDLPGEAWVTVTFFLGLWLGAASFLSSFSNHAYWATGLGSRYLFPAVPLLAAFAGKPLERATRTICLMVTIPSIFCGYLSAQAGLIPGADVFPYAVKTMISGTGMGVFFKEALPAWLRFETLHTVVSRPDVSAWDLIQMLPTLRGLELIRNQGVLLAANATVLAGLGWIISRLWRMAPVPAAPLSPSPDGQATTDDQGF